MCRGDSAMQFLCNNSIQKFLLTKGVDNENCSWALETDLHSNSLRFPFYLQDINKIPRNHLRLGNYLLIYALVQTSRTHCLCSLTKSIRGLKAACTIWSRQRTFSNANKSNKEDVLSAMESISGEKIPQMARIKEPASTNGDGGVSAGHSIHSLLRSGKILSSKSPSPKVQSHKS